MQRKNNALSHILEKLLEGTDYNMAKKPPDAKETQERNKFAASAAEGADTGNPPENVPPGDDVDKDALLDQPIVPSMQGDDLPAVDRDAEFPHAESPSSMERPPFANVGKTKPMAPFKMLTKDDEGTNYAVSLQDNPRLVIRAEDRWDAVQRYYKVCGIKSTINQPTVEKAGKNEELSDLPEVM